VRLPQVGGPGPRNFILQGQGGPIIPLAQGSLSVASHDSHSYCGSILTRLHTRKTTESQSQIQSNLKTVGQTASLSWYQATIWDPRTIFLFHGNSLKISMVFSLWGAFSEEKRGLQFNRTFATGSRERCQSWAQVSQNSSPYLTVSFETPQTWGPGPLFLSPRIEWPSHTPCTGFHFHSFLGYAGLKLRYSNPPQQLDIRGTCEFAFTKSQYEAVETNLREALLLLHHVDLLNTSTLCCSLLGDI
jgi:hypothetical protein